MLPIKITSKEVYRSLSDLLNRVVYRNESFIIQRNGRDVATLGPVENGNGPEKSKKQKRAAA